jgi:hypothetical protein
MNPYSDSCSTVDWQSSWPSNLRYYPKSCVCRTSTATTYMSNQGKSSHIYRAKTRIQKKKSWPPVLQPWQIISKFRVCQGTVYSLKCILKYSQDFWLSSCMAQPLYLFRVWPRSEKCRWCKITVTSNTPHTNYTRTDASLTQSQGLTIYKMS